MLEKSFLGHSPLGFHNIAYTEWGDAASQPPVICAHGLTRNGRDFDRLAAALAADHRHIFCPDVVGRGKSAWLANPALYGYPQYVADMTMMIARTGSNEVDYIGTSMGGIIGMMVAGQKNSPIRRLVVNDIGPFVALDALKRISDYVSWTREFADLAVAEHDVRQRLKPFGVTSDDDWRELTENSVRKLDNGKYVYAYDPAIGNAFKGLKKDIDFWDIYDRIQCPMLLLRGAKSDVLSEATAHEMTQRGPKPRLIEYPNVGHAPALMDAQQIEDIREFLDAANIPRPQTTPTSHRANQTEPPGRTQP